MEVEFTASPFLARMQKTKLLPAAVWSKWFVPSEFRSFMKLMVFPQEHLKIALPLLGTNAYSRISCGTRLHASVKSPADVTASPVTLYLKSSAGDAAFLQKAPPPPFTFIIPQRVQK